MSLRTFARAVLASAAGPYPRRNPMPDGGLTPDEEFDMAVRLAMLEGFAHWLISLDDPGSEDRRQVTLNRIIERARKALRVEAAT